MLELPIVEPVLAFVREHHAWAALVVALLVLGESIAFISLLVPATAILLAAGAMVGAGIIPLPELIIMSVVGCLIGDAISYFGGKRLGPHTHKVWPFRDHPKMLEQGERFFKTVGPWGVLIGRFFGPLRAVVPLCAGAMGMKFLPFLLMSALSAPVFICIYVLPGALVAYGMTSADGMSLSTILPMALPLLIGVAGAYFVMQRYKQAYNLKDEAELDR